MPLKRKVLAIRGCLKSQWLCFQAPVDPQCSTGWKGETHRGTTVRASGESAEPLSVHVEALAPRVFYRDENFIEMKTAVYQSVS